MKFCAEILIGMNEKLGNYKNDHLKRVLAEKDESAFRFYQVPISKEHDLIKIRSNPDKER